jgi:NADH dehydrogenase
VGTTRVVIVGGGFGGLTAARALARAPVSITLIDRRNHHLFQPLLYQVATAGLSPAQIAAPIRRVLKSQRNIEVLLGEVIDVSCGTREVVLEDARIPYDWLIVATGATHSYFGHEAWSAWAPGLKTVEDALEIRGRFLMAFERAERADREDERRAELTFVVVGAGPTGVETAGAMIEMARRSIPRDFRRIDTASARVVLIEAKDRVLPGGFPEELSGRARRDLEELGVEVRLGSRVTAIDPEGVTVESASGVDRIPARNVIWAAGVRASTLGAAIARSSDAPLDASGRVKVAPDLSVPGRPEVFVIGDLACVADATYGTVPGMAPGAMQMGRHVARIIREACRGGTPARPAFEYQDKGLLATIGRARAVAALGKLRFAGFPAWALWAGLHIVYLIGFRSKLLVMIEWAWAYLVFERGARLITGDRHR